jgi:hypothetical protein
MKRSARRLLMGVLVVLGLASLFIMTAATQDVPKKVNLPKSQIPAPRPFPCNGPDLAVTLTSVKAVYYGNQWWVECHGKIMNNGSKDYDGKLGQAVVQLTRKRLWDPAHPTVMSIYNVTHLAKGAFQFVQGSFQLEDYVRAGCVEPLSQNECCREVQMILKVVFDPDIRSDGNPNNDDCNPNNDTNPDTPDTHVKFTASCIK